MSLVPAPVAGSPAPIAAPVPNPVAYNFSAGTAISSQQVDTNFYQLWTFLGSLTASLNGPTYCSAPAISSVAFNAATIAASVGSAVPGAGSALTLDLAHGDYVDLANTQTAAGVKTFSGGIVSAANGYPAQFGTIASTTSPGTFLKYNYAGDNAASGSLNYRDYDGKAFAIVGAATGTNARFVRLFDYALIGGTVSSPATVTSGDLYLARSATTGALQFGNTNTRYLFYDGTSYQFNGANLVVNGMTYASSRSFKQDVAPIAFDSIARIKACNVVSFRYKKDLDISGASPDGKGDNDQRQHHGLIAEDTPREFLSPDGKGIEGHTTLAIALDAIKRMATRIEKLEARLGIV